MIFYIPDDLIKYDYDVSEARSTIIGNAIKSGDDDYDMEIEHELIDRLNNGDIWAWFSFQVKAILYADNETKDEYKTFVGKSSIIDCCSYPSYDDFVADTSNRSGLEQEAKCNLKRRVAEYIIQHPLDRIIAVDKIF